jgi:hypothetical protein
MTQPAINTGGSSADEQTRRLAFVEMMRRCPIPDRERIANQGLFLNRQTLSRLMFFEDLYRRIVPVHGVIMEFGVRWGQNLALFTMLRGIHEPYNLSRRIIGFDTFAGFPSVDAKDGGGAAVEAGGYGVSDGYEDYLAALLAYHEAECPLGHVRKHELVKGDACQTVPEYLKRHPETVISLAYFDMDIYKPTREVLEAIRPHLTRGAIIGFDEVCNVHFPGETVALQEVLGVSNVALRRSPLAPSPCWMEWDPQAAGGKR